MLKVNGDAFIEIIISAPDSARHSITFSFQISSQIGMPILTPLILTGPDKFPGVNIRCSSKTPEFGNSYLSLNVEISPFSITNTEFLIVFFSFLGAPTIMDDLQSFVALARFSKPLSTKSKKSSLRTKSSIG